LNELERRGIKLNEIDKILNTEKVNENRQKTIEKLRNADKWIAHAFYLSIFEGSALILINFLLLFKVDIFIFNKYSFSIVYFIIGIIYILLGLGVKRKSIICVILLALINFSSYINSLLSHFKGTTQSIYLYLSFVYILATIGIYRNKVYE